MTLQKHPPGLAATIKIALVNEAGVALAPTSLSFRVLDAAELVLQPFQAISVVTGVLDGHAVIPLPATLMTLVAPAVTGLRTIELQVVTADGTFDLSESFLLQGVTGLAFGVNSFMTYGQSQLLSREFAEIQMPGWNASSRSSREAALIESYDRILMLPIVLEYDDDQSRMTDWSGAVTLRSLTPAQLGGLGNRMTNALRKAQLVEADEILNGDPVTLARRNGLLSMTVGESSQFFRSAKALEMPVSTRAAKYLERWLRFSARLVRR